MTAGSSPRRRPIVAIDGPAGAGKSTLAAYLARRFGFLNLETGAMYRALALKALEHAVALDEEAPLMRLTATTQIVLEPRASDSNRVLLDGADVTLRIRAKDVAEAASQVSVHPAVRAWMVARQRAMGAQGGVVMEGRDIGTQVFPDAEVKIFLDADDVIRGQRRFLQSADPAHPLKRNAASEAEVLAGVRERDARDRSRATSPLVPAADAVHLDTSSLPLEQVCAQAEALVLAKLGESRSE
ncbi:MAG: (d)CMP kinase [Acidobacteriaceae bacterium]